MMILTIKNFWRGRSLFIELTKRAFSECLIRSPYLITSSPNLTKKVVFPLGILSMVSTGVALIHMIIGFLVWLVDYFSILMIYRCICICYESRQINV